MLIFLLKNNRQNFEKRHEGGPIEFGREAPRGLPRIVVEDEYTARHQLKVEELPTGDVRVENLSVRPITLALGGELAPSESRILVTPTQLSFGYTSLQISVIPYEQNDHQSSLHTISRPLARQTTHASNVTFSGALPTSGEAPTPEVLTHWFETLLTVQKAAAGSDAFYRETAAAVVQLVGLDHGMVLLREAKDWNVVARHSPSGREIKFSRRVVEEVVSKRSTFYQLFSDSAHEGSLQMVDAVVASPIFDDQDQVVGVVYGSRDMQSMDLSGKHGIQPLEAQLVQVLAGAVSAGLARVSREAEAARTRVQFEQFVSPELAKALERDAGILAAKERELTLLFADLRGFSRISEQIGAAETYNLLSDILDRMTNQIMDHGGVVIDYYGDGLAAMFNAPFDQPNHAELAVHAAQAMQNELPAINQTWAERLGGRIRLGIGINTGRSQVGNSGSKRRLKYGPRGHAVNLASRVEAATKVVGLPCLLTQSTRELLPANVPVRRLWQSRLTGMASAVNLYELPTTNPSEQWLKQRTLYEQALAFYEADKPAECIEVLNGLIDQFGAHDNPTIQLRLRAQSRLSQPSGILDPVLAVETK